MKRDCDYYANEFVEGLLEQDRAIWQSLGTPYMRKQERRFSKAAEKLTESEDGVRVFIRLLDHKSPHVALTAAVYLLDTSAEMKAVEKLREYAKGPEEDFDASCARERLKEWEKQKKKKH